MTEPTDEQLRERIALACGWRIGKGVFAGMGWRNNPPIVECFNSNVELLPDCPRDLNAMAAAEATLTDEQKERYVGLLMPQWHDVKRAIWRDVWDATHSSARQRALAFVRTVEGSEV